MAQPEQITGVSDAPAAPVHLLQGCSINHDGPAPVSSYFLPKSTGATSGGLDVLEASFRGRRMLGAELPLPAGYAGVVLERQAPADGADAPSPSPGGGDAPPPAAAWRAAASFRSLYAWSHDTPPLAGDALRRCLEWAAAAAALHAPVPPADVDAEVARAAAAAAAAAEGAAAAAAAEGPAAA